MQSNSTIFKRLLPSRPSQEERLLAEAYHFQTVASEAWTEKTKYPDQRYEFSRYYPSGQCGVTNFGFGVWLVRRGVAKPSDIYYSEGDVYAADGQLIGDHHAWLRIEGKKGLQWRTDFTIEQYPDINMRIVVQGVQHAVREYPGVNSRYWSSGIDRLDTAGPLQYVCKGDGNGVALDDYDAAKFQDRLGPFLRECESVSRFLGRGALAGQELWLPYDSRYD
jgi:hypothetical protein